MNEVEVIFWIKLLEFAIVAGVSSTIGVWIGYFLSKRQRSHETKSQVLRDLVSHKPIYRKNFTEYDQVFITTLSSIPVIFSANDEVKTNWRLFTRVLEEDRKHPGTIKEEVKNKRFSDLVLAICRSLSIKTKEDDINLLSSFKS